jgi:hypothetical protein
VPPPGTAPEDPPAAAPIARPPVADRAGTKIVLRVRRARAPRGARLAVVTAHGRLAGVRRGVVHIELAGRARDRGTGLRRQRRTARIDRDGRFALRVRVARGARWRVSARFAGSAAFLPGAYGVVVVIT